MTINFLNSIDLNQNELIHGTIENQPNDTAAGTPVSGQLYYNTTNKVLKYGKDDGTGTIVWSEIDTDTGITSIELDSDGNATSGNTITQNGILTLSFDGQSTDYVNGEGNLVTFPTIPTVPSNIVETVVTTNGTYIDLTPTTAASGNVTITADLSASGTPDDTKYLRGDNAWEPISSIPGTYEFTLSDNANPAVSGVVEESDTVTIAATSDLTSNLTGQSTTSKLLTVGLKVNGGVGVSDNYVVNQSSATAAADDTIPFNNFTDNANPALRTNIVNKTTFGTIPVNALTLVKQYIDDSVAGGLVYQGGYDASSNSPDLTTSPNSIEKGWTYTVTVEGTFFGEQLRVGDVLIAEVDDPSSLSDWTTVQNNIDIATDGTVSGAGAAIIGISRYDEDDFTVDSTGFVQLNSTSFATTITDTATITHNLNSKDVIIQLYDVTTDETVYADVDRASVNTATITFASTPTNSVRVLVQKIG